MNRDKQTDNKSESNEGDTPFSFKRMIVGVIAMIAVLIIAKFFPVISETINRIFK
jgi:hypothetical protein